MLSGAKVMPGSIETDRRTRELAAVATDDTASGRGWTVGGCGGDRTGLLLGCQGKFSWHRQRRIRGRDC